MRNRLHIIYNPVAGKGSALKKIPLVRSLLEENGIEYTLTLTEKVGHAIELAAESLDGSYSAVIAAGGDGTGNEVINGMMSKGRDLSGGPVFGILKVGRGNDFAYGVGVPGKLDQNVAMFKTGKAVPLDVGFIRGGDYPQGRYFGNGIGIGFDTLVGFAAARMTHVHGAMAYALGALKIFIEYPEAPTVKLTYNGTETVLKTAQISVMNCRRMGGTFFMAPAALNDDGFFDICISKQVKRAVLIKTILAYTKGSQAGLEHIITARTASLSVEALTGGLAIHADGETICTAGKIVDMEIRPSALRIFSL